MMMGAVCSLCLLLSFPCIVRADTLYLKNGHSISGVIKNEDEESVELEISIGTVKFGRKELERIERTTSVEEAGQLRKQWAEEQQKAQVRVRLQEKPGRQVNEEKAKIDAKTGHIITSALINGKVKANLIVDTGASIVVLSRETGEKLAKAGVRPAGTQEKEVELTLGDGRKIKADFVILESLRIEDSVAENIEAAIMPDEQTIPGYDGVLGMSFLNKFNFGFKQKEGTLTLEKLK